MLEWHRYRQGVELGEWDETPHDPLIVLFAHADHDGVIHPAQAVPLADSLESLLPRLRDVHIARITEQMIAGLREAAAAGEDVEFA